MFGAVTDPTSLNQFIYGNDSPVGNTDPTGLGCFNDGGTVYCWGKDRRHSSSAYTSSSASHCANYTQCSNQGGTSNSPPNVGPITAFNNEQKYFVPGYGEVDVSESLHYPAKWGSVSASFSASDLVVSLGNGASIDLGDLDKLPTLKPSLLLVRVSRSFTALTQFVCRHLGISHQKLWQTHTS